MEREQAVSVVKLVSYLLIIVGIIILSATIIYFSNGVQIDWLSYVGIIVGGLMLGIGTAIINLIKKLKLDIKYEN